MLSRERAVDQSHRILEQLLKGGALLTAEREFVRNRVLDGLLSWESESSKVEAEVRRVLLARARKPPEGSREWDLLATEERERLYVKLLGQGE